MAGQGRARRARHQVGRGRGACARHREHLTALKAAAAKPGAVIKKLGDVDAGAKGRGQVASSRITSCRSMAHAPMEPMNFTAGRAEGLLPRLRAHAVPAARAGHRGPGDRSQTGAGHGQDDVPGWRVRTPHRRGLHRPGGGDLQGMGGGPVKWCGRAKTTWTHDFYRPTSFHQMSGALDAQGRPVVLKFHLTSPSVTSRLFPPVVKDGVDPFMTEARPFPTTSRTSSRTSSSTTRGYASVLALGLARAQLVRVRVVHGRARARRRARTPTSSGAPCSTSSRASSTCWRWRPRSRAGARSPRPDAHAASR